MSKYFGIKRVVAWRVAFALLAAQNAAQQWPPLPAASHIDVTSERKVVAKLTIPEIQRLAREVFGRRLTAAEVRAYGRGVESMANTVALLEGYLERAGDAAPAIVHRVLDQGIEGAEDGDDR